MLLFFRLLIHASNMERTSLAKEILESSQAHALNFLHSRLRQSLVYFKSTYCFCQTKVSYLKSSCFSVYKNVFRFDVSMYESVAVNLLQSNHQLTEQIKNVFSPQRGWRLVNKISQCLTISILHLYHNAQTHHWNFRKSKLVRATLTVAV